MQHSEKWPMRRWGGTQPGGRAAALRVLPSTRPTQAGHTQAGGSGRLDHCPGPEPHSSAPRWSICTPTTSPRWASMTSARWASGSSEPTTMASASSATPCPTGRCNQPPSAASLTAWPSSLATTKSRGGGSRQGGPGGVSGKHSRCPEGGSKARERSQCSAAPDPAQPLIPNPPHRLPTSLPWLPSAQVRREAWPPSHAL